MHRLLLTLDSLASHQIIMSSVSRVVHGTREVLTKKRTKDSAVVVGEEAIEPGKSVVFGAMETCMCLLARYFPSIFKDSGKMQQNPRLSVTSKGMNVLEFYLQRCFFLRFKNEQKNFFISTFFPLLSSSTFCQDLQRKSVVLFQVQSVYWQKYQIFVLRKHFPTFYRLFYG